MGVSLVWVGVAIKREETNLEGELARATEWIGEGEKVGVERG